MLTKHTGEAVLNMFSFSVGLFISIIATIQSIRTFSLRFDDPEDTGKWTRMHGDALNGPVQPELLAAVCGISVQFGFTFILLFILAPLYPGFTFPFLSVISQPAAVFQATRYCGLITKRDLLWTAQLTIIMFSGPIFNYLAVSGGNKSFYMIWWFCGIIASFMAYHCALYFTKWWGLLFFHRSLQRPKLIPVVPPRKQSLTNVAAILCGIVLILVLPVLKLEQDDYASWWRSFMSGSFPSFFALILLSWVNWQSQMERFLTSLSILSFYFSIFAGAMAFRFVIGVIKTYITLPNVFELLI
eukprot:TRINITY_DN2248_c0_g1_i2.p1 TRINITY_DN2248_c0_g1~~TRINITY_DN2248_c0_g1_i2.p1  ORF type:complete len:300 (+),score=34.56 TRINITY_DN2248_c0_g1_i2:657-1556(+)